MTCYDYLIYRYGGDILSSPGMKELKIYPHHGDVCIYDHAYSVAVMCMRLTRSLRLKTDERTLIRGALLHNYYLYDWHVKEESHKWHVFTHPNCALKNACRDFALSDAEKDMIGQHMFPVTPQPPTSRESAVLCLADKLCTAQEYWNWGVHRWIKRRP